jgi:exodeoxyribonuclease-5
MENTKPTITSEEIPLITVPRFVEVTPEGIDSQKWIITTPDGKKLNEQQTRAVLLMEAWYLMDFAFFRSEIGVELLQDIIAQLNKLRVANGLPGDIAEKTIDDSANMAAYLQEWFEGDFTLVGYAGVGKTSSLSTFISRIKQQDHLTITLTAPTNKAVKVLKSFGQSARLTGIEYQTIYAAMGMKLEVDDDGKENAVGDPDGKQNLSEFDLAVLDEASMLNASMFTRINGLSNRPRFIYMGDSKQLKPVNDKSISLVFSNVLATFTLDKVMRYKEGSAIAKLVTTVRDNVGQPYWIDPTEYADNDSLVVCDNMDFLDRLIEDLESDRYQDNPDSVKAIAYTNKVVDWLNTYCHNQLYGNKEAAFVPGERLVSTKPVTRWSPSIGTEVILKNRFEIDVLKSDEDEIKWDATTPISLFEEFIDGTYENIIEVGDGKKKTKMSLPTLLSNIHIASKPFKMWRIRASVVDEDRRVRLNLIDPSERQRLEQSLDSLRILALAIKSAHLEKRVEWKKAWRELFKLRDMFDSVVHSYAITTHGSQGSSYPIVYVTERDLMRCKDPLERSQLHYVAYSRAMEKLVISM